MIPLRWIAIGSAVAVLLVTPTGAIGTPAAVPGPVLVAGSLAPAGRPALASPGARKPSASVAVDGRILASGKVHLTVTSNAKSVKVSYRTAQGKARTVMRKAKGGSAHITLPAGSRSIRVRARSTSRLAASGWLPVEVLIETSSPAPSSDPGPGAPSPGPAPSTPPAPDAGTTDFEAEVGRLVNEARATARSCGTTPYPAAPALSMNDLLVRSARAHSQDMAANGYFSHTGLDGSQPWDRMSAAGYVWSAAGENIAAGQPTPQQVINAWLTSSGHCANIMSDSFTEIGVGHAYSASAPYGHYWTQNFGSNRHE